MADLDTIKAITTNLENLLEGLGIRISDKSVADEDNAPGIGTSPICNVMYDGEEREYSVGGEKPGYAEAEFTVALGFNSPGLDAARDYQQQWYHAVKDAVTIDALNAGALAASKLVSRVTIGRGEVSRNGPLSIVMLEYKIRYREV